MLTSTRVILPGQPSLVRFDSMPEAISKKKVALILLAMGGPDSLEGIGQYLYNIFSDRSIIRLPGGWLMQKPLARLISTMRKKKVQAHYSFIGGSSPLLKWTESQLAHILRSLDEAGHDLAGYVGMRYYFPMIEEAIQQAYNDGCRQIIFFPMYPQFCKATTGSSFEVVEQVASRYSDLSTVMIRDFHDDQAYIDLLSEYIDTNIGPDETLLFSAHSIPQKFVDEGDPYVDQTRRTVEMAAGDREHFLSFQSRSGPVEWVGPDTVEEATRLLSEGRKLFVVPISFVCDHIETLYELDLELPQLVSAEASGLIRRMPMFNDDVRFGQLLAALVRERIADPGI
ncbi:MAG: ferrochelatase [bacterium]|nr:ferrochelatase [bacterium]